MLSHPTGAYGEHEMKKETLERIEMYNTVLLKHKEESEQKEKDLKNLAKKIQKIEKDKE